MTEQDMLAADAVQDKRTAALDALAAENGITRGDLPLAPYGTCEGCGGDDMHAGGCDVIENNGAN
jgi:hypothetical protein